MAFNDFAFESIEKDLGITVQSAPIFGALPAPIPPAWLRDSLDRGMQLALVSEKARSEFIVAPILLAVRELCHGEISILSGQRLDVDPARKLTGECDFILARSAPLPRLRSPLLTVVEAKKNDLDAGLAQCIAQMVAAQLFNRRSESDVSSVFGCITSGEDWQFLKLSETTVAVDPSRRYINDIASILAALVATVTR